MTDDDTITIDTRDRSFMVHGACRGLPYGFMFPDHGVNATEQKAICATCPVIDACREYGIDEHYGVWGGTTEQERRAMRRGLPPRRRKARVMDHGTERAYHSCRRREQGACDACTQAHLDEMNNRAIQRLRGAA